MFNFIFTADKASKKPLYEQLYSYVADEIKNKNIKKKLKSYGNQPIYILSKLILIIAFDYMCTDR